MMLPFFFRNHDFGGGLAAIEYTFQVGINDEIEVFFRGGFGGFVDADAGIINHDVQPAQLFG